MALKVFPLRLSDRIYLCVPGFEVPHSKWSPVLLIDSLRWRPFPVGITRAISQDGIFEVCLHFVTTRDVPDTAHHYRLTNH